jgi:hypothetical protein
MPSARKIKEQVTLRKAGTTLTQRVSDLAVKIGIRRFIVRKQAFMPLFPQSSLLPGNISQSG